MAEPQPQITCQSLPPILATATYVETYRSFDIYLQSDGLYGGVAPHCYYFWGMEGVGGARWAVDNAISSRQACEIPSRYLPLTHHGVFSYLGEDYHMYESAAGPMFVVGSTCRVVEAPVERWEYLQSYIRSWVDAGGDAGSGGGLLGWLFLTAVLLLASRR